MKAMLHNRDTLMAKAKVSSTVHQVKNAEEGDMPAPVVLDIGELMRTQEHGEVVSQADVLEFLLTLRCTHPFTVYIVHAETPLASLDTPCWYNASVKPGEEASVLFACPSQWAGEQLHFAKICGKGLIRVQASPGGSLYAVVGMSQRNAELLATVRCLGCVGWSPVVVPGPYGKPILSDGGAFTDGRCAEVLVYDEPLQQRAPGKPARKAAASGSKKKTKSPAKKKIKRSGRSGGGSSSKSLKKLKKAKRSGGSGGGAVLSSKEQRRKAARRLVEHE